MKPKTCFSNEHRYKEHDLGTFFFASSVGETIMIQRCATNNNIQ